MEIIALTLRHQSPEARSRLDRHRRFLLKSGSRCNIPCLPTPLSFRFHSSPAQTVAFPLHYTPWAICLCAPNTPTTCLAPFYATNHRERGAQTAWKLGLNNGGVKSCLSAFLCTTENGQKECRRILKTGRQNHVVLSSCQFERWRSCGQANFLIKSSAVSA